MSKKNKQLHGVTAAQEILVLLDKVRILMQLQITTDNSLVECIQYLYEAGLVKQTIKYNIGFWKMVYNIW